MGSLPETVSFRTSISVPRTSSVTHATPVTPPRLCRSQPYQPTFPAPCGLNSDRLLPRNVHLSLPGIEVPRRYGACFAVAEDRLITLPTSDRSVPFIEFQQAIGLIERFKHFAPRHPLL